MSEAQRPTRYSLLPIWPAAKARRRRSTFAGGEHRWARQSEDAEARPREFVGMTLRSADAGRGCRSRSRSVHFLRCRLPVQGRPIAP